jgi:hypothetical protein
MAAFTPLLSTGEMTMTSDALGDEVLDVGELLAQVLVGDGDFERHVLRGRLRLLHRVGKRDVEGMLLGQQRCADAFRRSDACHHGEGCAGQENAAECFTKHDFLRMEPALAGPLLI